MAFGRKQAQIDQLTAERDELQQTLELYVSADTVFSRIVEELGSTALATQLREDAEAIAHVAVIQQEKNRIVGELSERIKRERYDEIAAAYRAGEGSKIEDSLRELFEQDGTFDALRQEAEAQVVIDIQREVMEAVKAEVAAELRKEETVQALKGRMSAELRDDPRIIAFRDGIVAEERARLEPIVMEETKATIVAEERAKEAERKAEIRQGLLESAHIERLRAITRQQLESEWQNTTLEKVQEEVHDEELQRILDARVAMERDAELKRLRSEQLLAEFTGFGVDVTKLTEGDELTIYLGTYGQVTYRPEGARTDVQGVGVLCQRKLKLLVIGENKCSVEQDTLLDAASPYEKIAALHRGTVIAVGRKMSENSTKKLHPFIKADVPFYYDDDTTDEEIFKDSLLTVANVRLNGVFARPTDKVNYVGFTNDVQ